MKINLDFRGNEAALFNSGLELADVPVRRREVSVPTNVILTDAPTTGCLLP